MDVDSSSDDSSSDDDSSSGDDMETDIERHVRELDYSLERQLDLRISKKFETYDARVAAAAVEALGRLADESDNDANCAAIADTGGISPLVGFVALYDSAEGQFWAARALRKIASKNTANKVAIVEAGGIQVFVDLVANGSGEGPEEAARALQNLACNATNSSRLIIERLVGLLSRGAARGRKAAARALGSLARDNAAIRVAIVAAGAVDPLVVMRDAGGRLKEAAEAALEALDLAAIASRVEALHAENESLTRRLEAKCVVCFERAPDVVFMPCFHVVSCRDCGLREEVDTCPVCRVPIEQKHRVYVS